MNNNRGGQNGPKNIDELFSTNHVWMKVNEKRALYRNILQGDGMNFKEALKCVTNSDAVRMLEGAGVNRVKRSLQANVPAPKDPKADGKALWAKLSKDTKRKLKEAFETKKFKEALESVGMSADSVGTFNTLGREWMRLKVKDEFGVEITMMPPGTKRTREELEESTEVLKGLSAAELASIKTKLETLSFAKALEDLSDEVKIALRKLGREGVKDHWKEHMQVEMTLCEAPREAAKPTAKKEDKKAATPAKAKATVGVPAGAKVFAELNDEQKTKLKEHLETMGFKVALETMEFAKEQFEALLRDGREVMKKNMKEFLGEEIKLWTKEDDAKAKVVALSKEVKQQLCEALNELPYNEAVMSLGDGLPQTDRNALRALTRSVTVEFLKEGLEIESLELQEEEALRELCLSVAMDSMDDQTRLVLLRLLGKHSFAAAVMSEELEVSSMTRFKLMAASAPKVIKVLEENYKMPVITVLDNLRLLLLRQPYMRRMQWKSTFVSAKFEEAVAKLTSASAEDKALVKETSKAGVKKVLDELYGESNVVMFEDRPTARPSANMRNPPMKRARMN